MKTMAKKITVLCLAGLLAFSMTGCGNKAASEKQAAKVNDTVITEGELYTYTLLELYRDGYDPSEIDQEKEKNNLESIINAEAIQQYYNENGIDIYDDAYNAAKNSFLEDIESSGVQFLDQNDITEEELIHFFRSQYVTSRFFEETRNAYSSEAVLETALNYYESHKQDYAVEPEKRISMILTNKKSEAESAVSRFAAGETFPALARELSIDDNSAAFGGDLGFFTKQQCRDRFGKGVFNMGTGSVTAKPVRTADGWAIVRITDFNNSGYKSFDEVSQGIIYSLYENYNKDRLTLIKEGMKIEEK